MKEKLNLLKLNELSNKEIKGIKGGQVVVDCNCACAWVNCGGSSSVDNSGANNVDGLNSPAYGGGC